MDTVSQIKLHILSLNFLNSHGDLPYQILCNIADNAKISMFNLNIAVPLEDYKSALRDYVYILVSTWLSVCVLKAFLP